MPRPQQKAASGARSSSKRVEPHEAVERRDAEGLCGDEFMAIGAITLMRRVQAERPDFQRLGTARAVALPCGTPTCVAFSPRRAAAATLAVRNGARNHVHQETAARNHGQSHASSASSRPRCSPSPRSRAAAASLPSIDGQAGAADPLRGTLFRPPAVGRQARRWRGRRVSPRRTPAQSPTRPRRRRAGGCWRAPRRSTARRPTNRCPGASAR